ncbi:MAG: MiaB/RimO family radical SAM methylthiotransferase [Candidatus Riflebacteria bacterium]|nr:MiaB/RimO family radical SAM methylthiotransferase [Candidatus Riflebacteria bacterium]
MNKFLLHSFGCKVSQYDGKRLEERLMDLGLIPVEDGGVPDVFLLNGCAVTGRASQKVRQAARTAMRRWPQAVVIVTGCEAKRHDISGESDPIDAHAVLPVGADDDEIRRCLESCGVLLSPSPRHACRSSLSGGRTRAFLKIQDGCSQFCTYCIVPYLRGTETSKSLEEAVAEGRALAAAGYRELVVTGIHIGHYAHDLVTLLRELEKIDGIDRLRLSSIEPLEVSDDLIDWMSTSSKACPHLHIPLQAGHDAVLAAMNRPYRTAAFTSLIRRIRERLPDAGLTTDLIVGFPGETDEQFSAGLAFVEAMAFSRLHIFRYSVRPGTPAANFADQISGSVKQARARAADAVWRRLEKNFAASFVGHELEVLWEKCEAGMWHGLSREYLACRLSASTVSGMTDLSNVVMRVLATRTVLSEATAEEVSFAGEQSMQQPVHDSGDAVLVIPTQKELRSYGESFDS